MDDTASGMTGSPRDRRPHRAAALVLVSALLPAMTGLAGCAAFHPLRGVPASYVPSEYRGEQRSGWPTINLSLLVRSPQAQYRIDAGDVLAVYIPGVLGKLSANLEEAGEEPPINNPFTATDPPTIGYPVTVRDDGTIPLPYVDPVHVAGRTLPEVEDAIRRAYSVDTTILANTSEISKRIVISLQRPREYRVLVVRQEQGDQVGAQNQVSNVNIGASKRGTARLVHLRAYENDVMHALAKAEGSTGLPGLDAENAIYVIRRRGRASYGMPVPHRPTPAPGIAPPGQTAIPGMPRGVLQTGGHSAVGGGNVVPAAPFTAAYAQAAPNAPGGMPPFPPSRSIVPTGHSTDMLSGSPPMAPGAGHDSGWGNPMNGFPLWSDDWSNMAATMNDPNIIRIPVRLPPGDMPHVSEDDVTLYDGDIVFIESRETEVFYTGGLLGGGQFTLPRDYDITLTQAISIAQGRATVGGAPRAIGGVSALNSDVTISPSRVVVLRTLPDGRRIPIEADLYRALRRPQEDLLIQAGDMIMLQYTPTEAVAAFFERHLLEGALFGIATAQYQTGGNQ